MDKKVEFDAANCVEEVVEVCELPENLGEKKISKKIGIGLCMTAITTAVVVLVRKRKGRFEKAAKKFLEKKGYTVVAPLDDLVVDEPVSDKVESKEN